MKADPLTMAYIETLTELLTPSHVYLRLRATTKSALLAELAKRSAGASGVLEPALAAALAAREALGSTGFGYGVAVPHARLPGLTRPFCAVAVLERPVAYDAVDGLPVDLVFLLLTPDGASSTHLALLAAASRKLRQPDVANAIRQASTPDAVIAALVG